VEPCKDPFGRSDPTDRSDVISDTFKVVSIELVLNDGSVGAYAAWLDCADGRIASEPMSVWSSFKSGKAEADDFLVGGNKHGQNPLIKGGRRRFGSQKRQKQALF
jgi:hypothetical protein